MKNLKDYFSSPKSLDVSLNDSLNGNQESPVENGPAPSKRKSKKSLSSKNSKRKKLCEDISAQSPTSTSQNSSIALDETIEEFDVVHPKSSKKKRKQNLETASSKSLSLKKRKSLKNDGNVEIEDVTSPQINPPKENISSKQNFLAKFVDKTVKVTSPVAGNCVEIPSVEVDTANLQEVNKKSHTGMTNHIISTSTKGNFFEKVKEKKNKNSGTCEDKNTAVNKALDKRSEVNNTKSLSETDKNITTMSTSIRGNFFEKVKEKKNKNNGTRKDKNNLVNTALDKTPDTNNIKSLSETDKNITAMSTSIKGNFLEKDSETINANNEECPLDKKDKENELPNIVKHNFFAKFTQQKNKDEESSSTKKEEATESKNGKPTEDVTPRIVDDTVEQKSGNTVVSKKRGRKRKIKNNLVQINKDDKVEPGVEQRSSKIDLDISKDIVENNDNRCQDRNNEVIIVEESSDSLVPNVDTSIKKLDRKSCKLSENSEAHFITSDKTREKKRKRKRKSDDLSGDEKNDFTDNLNEPTSTPENRRSLFNYFNKVDKSAVAFKSEEKRTIKVEVEVHEPRSTERSNHRPLLRRKVKKNRKQPDFDLITSEEDCSIVEETPAPVITPKKHAWKMRINIQSPGYHGDFEVENNSSEEANVTKCEEKSSSNDDEVVFINECSVEVVADQHRTSTPASKNDSDVLILDDESNSYVGTENTSEQSKTPSLKGAGTLAAYFGMKSGNKKDKKPEERSLATKMFLQSPAPPSLKKIVQQSNSELKEGTPAPFPINSHVRQKNKLSIMWNLPKCDLKFKSTADHTQVPSVPEFSQLCRLSEEVIVSSTVMSGSTKSEINSATKHLKEQEVNVPIKKWLENLRSLKKACGVGELWTDKYQPKTTDNVLIQRTNVSRLNDWLATFETNLAAGSDSESSGDEFINDKDEKVSKSGITALLVGPPGVGKTAAVYAAAKQNGYQVLELNASCNRNGKKVYHEFSEATQSHKVETKSLFKSKSKKKDKQKKSNKKSLLLIEDSDLVFNDLDDGYVNCLSQLQSSSKRPLVLVANDSSKHLTKLIPSSSSITLSFHQPPNNTLGCFLKSVSLVEGIVMPQEACDLLVESTKGDIRKSINNLQFYGPLYKQLDRRKLGLFDKNISVFSNSSFITKDEALITLEKAKNLCIYDLLSSNKDCGKFSWFRESTAVDPRNEEKMVDSLRTDISQVLASSLYLGTDHEPFPSYSESIKAHEGLNKAVDTNFYLKRGAIACDYSSSLRHMARAERIRLLTQTKRNKRYFNHLHNIGVDTADLNMLDVLCSTLTDDFSLVETNRVQFEDIAIID